MPRKKKDVPHEQSVDGVEEVSKKNQASFELQELSKEMDELGDLYKTKQVSVYAYIRRMRELVTRQQALEYRNRRKAKYSKKK